MRSLVLRFLGRLAHDYDLVEDCSQAARITLWKAHPQIEPLPPDGRLRYAAAWVRNAVCRQLRQDKRVPLPQTGFEPPAETAEAWNAVAAAAHHLWIEVEFIQGVVTGLSERDRQLLRLALWEDLGDSEIAARLGCSREAAKKGRQRALDRLRDRLR